MFAQPSRVFGFVEFNSLPAAIGCCKKKGLKPHETLKTSVFILVNEG